MLSSQQAATKDVLASGGLYIMAQELQAERLQHAKLQD